MEYVVVGEFSDEYQDGLGSSESPRNDAWLDIPIAELGSPRVVSASPSESVYDAALRMGEQGCGALIVVHCDVLVGIFTERDLCTRVICAGRDPRRTPLDEVMTTAPATVLETDTVGQALRVLVLEGFRHIVVVNACGTPTNVVSVRRIVEHVVEYFPEKVFNAPLDSQPPCTPVCDGG